jgi:predicted GNAT superfamily acetyltransferase
MAIVGIPAVGGIPTHLGCVCFVYLCFSSEFPSRQRKRMLPGDPDRLVAEWWIRSLRVRDLLGTRRCTPEPNGASISIPAAIRQICNTDPADAARVQARVREQFQRYITQGHAAVGLAVGEKQGSYTVEPYEDRIHRTP